MVMICIKQTKIIVVGFIALLFFPGFLLASTVEDIGTAFQVGLVTSSVGFSLYKRDLAGLKQYALSLGAASATAYALKYIVSEKRPNGADYHAFPSGHTTVAFANAGYLWRRYGFHYGLPATLLAGFVAYSRVEANKHYWHDVIAGAGIGLLSSWLFVKPIQITYSNEGVGVRYQASFKT